MSEDIHKWTDGRYTLMFDEHTFFVWDNVKDNRMTALNVTKKLNKQQSTITKLKELNDDKGKRIISLIRTNKTLKEENEQLKKSEKINMDYAEQIVEENHKIRIAKNDLRIENKKLKEEIKLLKPTNVEQYEQIVQLQEENEQLRQMIKENVFQRCAEGSLADLEFKAIAYDDIVRVEMSNESELKVIVSCKQGKKENVKSFCQMFIPFGVYYEIKELEDE